jgi:hypothetical protein
MRSVYVDAGGERDWEQCDRCGRLVCRIHSDGLYPIRYSGTDPNRGSDGMCAECVESANWAGEICSAFSTSIRDESRL